MSEQPYGDVNTGAPPPASDPAATPGYPPPPPHYGAPQNYGAPPPPYGQPGYNGDPYPVQPAGTASGLSDNAAGALAYITIIPAIIFLVMPPYNEKPFIKFHAFQCLGLAVVGVCLGIIGIIPILGWIVFFVGWLVLVVAIVICIIKASQGGAFKLPVIGNFAAQQSGYRI